MPLSPWDFEAFKKYYYVPGEPWGHPAGRPGILLHYHNWSIGIRQRSFYGPQIANLLGLKPGDSAIFLGCGFGWTAEGLASTGVEVVGTEISSYILGEKDQTEEAEIRQCIEAVGLDPDRDTVKIDGFTQQMGIAGVNHLDIYLNGGRFAPKKRSSLLILDQDMGTAKSRADISRSVVRANAAVVISEEVINSVDDAEALHICDIMANYASTHGVRDCRVIHMLSPAYYHEGKRIWQEPDLNWKTYSEWRAFLDSNGFQNQLILPSVTSQMQGILGVGDNQVVDAYSRLL